MIDWPTLPPSSKIRCAIEEPSAEMQTAGVTGVVIHPPASLGESSNDYALEVANRHPDRFCVLGYFDLARPDRDAVAARWRERPGMLGLRFAFNQPGQQALWDKTRTVAEPGGAAAFAALPLAS